MFSTIEAVSDFIPTSFRDVEGIHCHYLAATAFIYTASKPTSTAPCPCSQTPETPPIHSQAVARGANPRLKQMPRSAGTSIVEPLDRRTRAAHVNVSGSEAAQSKAVPIMAIGPDASQKTARAKSSLARSLCRQHRWDISSWGTLSGEGSESNRIARLPRRSNQRRACKRCGGILDRAPCLKKTPGTWVTNAL